MSGNIDIFEASKHLPPSIEMEDFEPYREQLQKMSASEQMRFILENLVKGKAKVRYEESESKYAPAEVDIQQLGMSKQDTKAIQDDIDAFIKYINSPYLHDGFGSDFQARRDWKDAATKIFGTEIGTALGESKFKWNKAGATMDLLSMAAFIFSMDEKLEKYQVLSEQTLEKIQNELVDEETYNSLASDDEKKEKMETVSQFLKEFIESFPKK
jgi:hypothetical protein